VRALLPPPPLHACVLTEVFISRYRSPVPPPSGYKELTCGKRAAGVTSENVAERYGITRAQQDELSARSHRRAAAARASGRFKDEIVPVHTIWKDPKTV
jgi:acetyl-CoA acetyltransferase